MRKWLVVTLVLTALVFAGSGIQAKEVLQLAHVYDPQHPFHIGARLAAKIVDEETGGELEIAIFPASQLGSEADITEAVIHGMIPIVITGAGQLGTLYPPFNVTEMPYVFRDIDHLMEFARSDIAAEMAEGLRNRFGVRVLGTSTFGIRHVIANKAINTPGDFRGFQLRVPEQQVAIAYARALGAEPLAVAYSEAYMALQQGIADGLENPLSALHSQRFYEVQDYVNLTQHVTNVTYFLMNEAVYQGLPEGHRAALDKAFAEAAEHVAELMKQQDEELIDFFVEQGLTVVEPDLDAFMAKAGDMAEDYTHWWAEFGEDLHERIRNIGL